MKRLFLIIFVLFLITGCAEKSKNSRSVYGQCDTCSGTTTTVPQFSTFKGNEKGKRIGNENVEEQNIAKSNEIEENANFNEVNLKGFKLKDIHFDFDSAIIKPQDIPYLEKLAEILKNNPEFKLIIEGHCDERGSEMYNLALGQRRADAVKKFLVNLGIEPERIQTISYGEEKPIDPRHTEEAWAKNRRCHFIIEK